MSNKPVLYYAPRSPPCRAVLLVARELGVDLELRLLNLYNKEHLTPEFLKINPQHTIPTLDDNGIIVCDSHVISAYLADKYGKDDKLYPKDVAKRVTVDARLHLDSGFLFARMRYLYEPILYWGSTDCSEEKISYIQKNYDVLEMILKDQDYLCGDHLTIADLCCIATVSSGDELAPMDKEKHPKLLAWMARLAQLPYYQELNGNGAEQLKKAVKTQLETNRMKQ